MKNSISKISKMFCANLVLILLVKACGGQYEYGEFTNLDTYQTAVTGMEDKNKSGRMSPPKKRTKEIMIDLSPIPNFIPPHKGGDRNFFGNGHEVEVLWARVDMQRRETKWDWITSQGAEHYNVYTHPSAICLYSQTPFLKRIHRHGLSSRHEPLGL